MYGCGAFPGGDGKETSQSHWRLGPSGLHGKGQRIGVQTSVAKESLKEFDLRNTPSLEESVRHSDIVYNLIGRDYPTKSV